MNKNKRIDWLGWIMGAALGVVLMTNAAVCLSGCATSKLEPGGVYAPVVTNVDGTVSAITLPDVGLFAADSAFELAVAAVDTVFKIERDNRALIWAQSHEIKHTLDAIRPQAVDAKRRYARARKAYLENPVAANLSTLETVLGEFQALASAATAALPSGEKMEVGR